MYIDMYMYSKYILATYVCAYVYNTLMLTFCFSASTESCVNCISTSVCTTLSGLYLNFSRLFNHSLSISPCELYLNANIAHDSLSEEACVELSSNMNYTIACPICIQDIFYKIPNSAFFNVEDCSNTGMHPPI